MDYSREAIREGLSGIYQYAKSWSNFDRTPHPIFWSDVAVTRIDGTQVKVELPGAGITDSFAPCRILEADLTFCDGFSSGAVGATFLEPESDFLLPFPEDGLLSTQKIGARMKCDEVQGTVYLGRDNEKKPIEREIQQVCKALADSAQQREASTPVPPTATAQLIVEKPTQNVPAPQLVEAPVFEASEGAATDTAILQFLKEKAHDPLWWAGAAVGLVVGAVLAYRQLKGLATKKPAGYHIESLDDFFTDRSG